MILDLLWGPSSWGKWSFGLFVWRLPEMMPLWCHLGPFWVDLRALGGHLGEDLVIILGGFWCCCRLFADTLADPLAGKPSSEILRSTPPFWHRAECGACHLGSARCPGGTQSACEGSCTYLNFCTSLPALTFLHYPALTFLHYTFQHSTSGLHSEDNFPQGVKFLLKISSEDISSEDNFPQIVIRYILNLI